MNKNQLGKSGLVISRLGLGTVEIGIANYAMGQKGLISEDDATRLLNEVVDLGITYIDTARAYGVAEERIGKSGILKKPGVVVGTKTAQFLEKGEDPRGTELEQRIRVDIEESLRMLQVDSLQLVQLHGGSKEQIERGEIIEVMQKLKDEGKIQHVGIATRGEEAPLAAIDSGFFETIQAAYSILDQRMVPHVLPKAAAAGVNIINRSVLLKGVLTKHYSKLPTALTPLKEAAAQAEQIALEIGTNLPSLALRFVLSHEAISTALVGTMKTQHLKAAQDAVEAGPLPPEIIAKLEALAISDPNLIDPSRWPKETQTV
ncbi:MAG: aldo/keto reductase [Candidatus Andersenbacteria bacterium]|nr:aldo/keto reductase [Candidatus Andersenbacteria bacterium]MBI3251146.1 aldo/keto reductase [Candidatus Andersenbacteria bacterium]